MIFNKRILVVEESIHIAFDESNSSHLEKNIEDDENILESELSKINEYLIQEDEANNLEETSREQQDQELPKSWKYTHSHLNDLIIGDTSQEVITRSLLRNTNNYLVFVSQIESKYIEEAKINPN